MEESNEILNELASVSPTLAAIDKINVFSVPESYFDNLSQRISTSVFLNEYPRAQAGEVPHNYFDELSNKIILKIKNADAAALSAEDETKNISHLLNSLKDKHVFNVPEGYFHTLGEQVLSKIKPKSAKVVSLHSGRKWLRYVAAAVITILVGIGALQLFNSKDSHDKIAPTQLAKNYAENMPAYIQDAIKYKTPEQLNKGLASLTDDEIVTYLEHHGNIMDDYLLIKDIDTKELPDATEYLIDENTLNDFLNQIDAQASNENSE
jgi:hypothetical protein